MPSPLPISLRRLPSPADGVLCLLAVWAAVMAQPSASSWARPAALILWVLVTALATSGLLARNQSPVLCMVLLTASLVLHLIFFREFSLLAALTGLTGAWTAQSRLRAPWRMMVTVSAYVAAGIGLLRLYLTHAQSPWDSAEVAVMTVAVWAVLMVATLGGASRRLARERAAAAADRAEVVRQAAVAAERTRIARDVHDLLGHSLAVIGMQAAGAQAVVSQDPAAAGRALTVIGQTARRSSQEVRDLVDMLQDDTDRRTSPVTLPEPAGEKTRSDSSPADLIHLVSLVDSFRQAGMEASLTLVYRAAARPSAVTVLGQVLREALTNAARHAPGQDVRTSLEISTHGCELMVVNTLSDPPAHPSHRIGTGTASMRSRLEAVGGRLEAGPQDGRWVLHAVVPQEVS